VRDAEPYLDEAIRSVAEQSYEDFEVIAVDDGSADGSRALLDSWAEADPRVRVLGQPSLGIVAALERARAESRGRYLARMDADDVSDPARFARQLEMLESDPALVLVGCLVEYFPRDALRDGARRYERWLNAAVAVEEIERELFVECPVAHPTFFMRSEAVARVGGYRTRGWPEDYDLVLRLWSAGGRLTKVPETLLRWREGADRLSRTHEAYAASAFRSCRVHHLLRAFPGSCDGVVVWGAGPVGKALSRELRSQGGRVVAFAEVDPRKIGQEIHGAPVLDTAGALGRRGALHLGAVGQEGARQKLRSIFVDAGLRELEDFVMVA
jgi:cellulose synthase/poly-beta-1,6-N-acetylglucosamine synthase-like glycosyltransferase